MAVKLRLLSYALGAEVCDVDVSRNMSEQAFGESTAHFSSMESAAAQPDAPREQHIEFSRRFGELDRHDALRATVIRNIPSSDGDQRAQAVTARRPIPIHGPNGTPTCRSRWCRRWARCCAATARRRSAATRFCQHVRAYDALSDGMKKLIADCTAFICRAREKSRMTIPASRGRRAEENQPTGRAAGRARAPETGRKALYIGEKSAASTA